MAINSDKLRLLRIMQILREETDEQHTLSAAKINDKLERIYGLKADRKTIYNDIELINEVEMEVLHTPSKKGGFYVGARRFELPELKLLVDAVQSSKFITTKKSEELIRKLGELTSGEEAKLLQRQVFIYNRPKTGNETIYYNVDTIHTAMYEDREITFQYTSWNARKELELKRGGDAYMVSPHALTWDDENYYLVAYDDRAGKIKHFRVDKMKNVAVTDQKRKGNEEFERFNLAEYAKKTFGMYGGHDENVSLVCTNELAGVLIDRFGKDIMLVPVDESHFRAHVQIAVSRQFFGWVTGIGKDMYIESPAQVKEEYKQYLQEIMQQYVQQ